MAAAAASAPISTAASASSPVATVTKSVGFSIISFNIGNARRDNEHLPLKERALSIAVCIAQALERTPDCAVICLQEVRATPNLTVADFIAKIQAACQWVAPIYHWIEIHNTYETTSDPFRFVAMFDPKKVEMVGAQSQMYFVPSVIQPGSARGIQSMVFRVPGTPRMVEVFNIHAPPGMSPAHRVDRSAYWKFLRSLLYEGTFENGGSGVYGVCRIGWDRIAVGDNNKFDEDTDVYDKWLGFLEMIPRDTTTFVSFTHDLNPTTKLPYSSSLDSVLVSSHDRADKNVFRLAKPVEIVSTLIENTGVDKWVSSKGTQIRPSDHFLIVASFGIDVEEKKTQKQAVEVFVQSAGLCPLGLPTGNFETRVHNIVAPITTTAPAIQ